MRVTILLDCIVTLQLLDVVEHAGCDAIVCRLFASAIVIQSVTLVIATLKRFNITKYVVDTRRGGATVLKVGGQILRAKRAENFFLTPPAFWPVGGQNIADIALTLV